MKTSYAAILAFLASGNAHMIMRTPKPIGSPNSSPLDQSGGDYPCKGTAYSSYDANTFADINQMTIGQSNSLSFTGSAVHGGGSCQVSLATGTKVDASTKWMVIQSYEGGCPADTTASGGGNLATDPSGTGAGTFSFTIPDHKDIPAGNYILAWTWHNRIGNREMYMNCAAVKLSGGSKKRYASESYNLSKRQQAPLPDLFKANIGNGCTTTEGTDVQYPDPGASVLKGANAKLGPPVGNCGSSGSSSPAQPAAGSSSAAGSATVSATGAASVAPTGANSIAPISQTAGGSFATVSAGGAAPSGASSATGASAAVQRPTQAASATASVAPVAPISTGTPATGGTAPAVGGSCNTGDWNCAADGKSFTRCIAGGTWSASIPMSQGLSCTPGISANFAYNLTGTSAKRDMRSHIARRRAGIHGAALS